MDELISELKADYGDDLLYVGMRGSQVLGLGAPTSDIDVAAIVACPKKLDKHNGYGDVMVFTMPQFVKNLKLTNLPIVEAILNPVYVADENTDTLMVQFRDFMKREPEYHRAFKKHVWHSLRRNLDGISKGEDPQKNLRYATLFYWMERETNPIDAYLSHQVPDHIHDQWRQIRAGQLPATNQMVAYANDPDRIHHYRSQIGSFDDMNAQLDAILLSNSLYQDAQLATKPQTYRGRH